ncbi:hypothetical protein [Eubacterium xylanophilum]|uniref:hypothetical protein n=1 Tax=Eubacterium xylanophilum TaxID=39497 RepID=UPI000479399C|nr:hypothetical protein [Eubacterium xylanophilum]
MGRKYINTISGSQNTTKIVKGTRMGKLYIFLKKLLIIILGIVWGVISFFWLGYSILSLGNFMEEPGSYDYVIEGDTMRIFGLVGLVIYALIFMSLFFLLLKKKYLYIFFISSVLGGGFTAIYMFFLR